MSYYDLSRPYSIDDWNNLVNAVNAKLENPPENTNCSPVDPIEEVEDPHRWSVEDIEIVRNKLIQTCSDINFSEPVEMWKPWIIDEIAAALEETWCDCEEECTDDFKHDENGTMIQYAHYDYTIYHDCGGPYPQPANIPAYTLDGMQVAKPGLKWRSVILRYDPEELWGGRTSRAISLRCDGTISSAGQTWEFKGSHGYTPWCPHPNYGDCCSNPIWVNNVLNPWLAYAETVEPLIVNFEIYTKRAQCEDC